MMRSEMRLVGALLALAVEYATFPPQSSARSARGNPQDEEQGPIAVRNDSGRSGAYYIPAGPRSQPVPLLVVLHGTGRSGDDILPAFRSPGGERFAHSAVFQGGSTNLKGLYLAVSDDATAWLLYLDPRAQSSALYKPVRAIPVCEVRADPTNRLWFRSAEVSDGFLVRFAGQLSAQGLTGTLVRVKARTGAALDTIPLTFRKIRERFLAGVPNPISGVYGNLRGTSSGDVYGRELVLVDAVDQVVALEVVYEGTPGWPEAALKAERVGDTLRLLWRTKPTEESMQLAPDTAVLGPNALIFRPAKWLVRGDTVQQAGDTMWKRLTLQQAFGRA